MDTVELATKLISFASITPNDAGCQQFIAAYLLSHGFKVEHLPFGKVSNLWATHGTGKPLLVLAGHTDVVPAGQLNKWSTLPFQPTVKDGVLYGRGTVDMKGGLAAMLAACCKFVEQKPKHQGTIAFFITSDEEVEAEDGTITNVVRLL